MLIGLDLDNTLVSYDHLFCEEARARGWLDEHTACSKKIVRDVVRASGDQGEENWQVLQARVYGHRMADARLMQGAGDFLRRCGACGIPLVIVSHKTQFARRDRDRIDLRRAATAWMERAGLFDSADFSLSPDAVFFEDTRRAKIARIADLGCTDFVDDLEEVFRDASFPRSVRRHLFAPQQELAPVGPFTAYRSWGEIADAVL